MIKLMAYCDSLQICGFTNQFFSVSVQPFHLDSFWSLHFSKNTWNAQTTFFTNKSTFHLYYFGVDNFKDIPLFSLNNKHSSENSHLRGCYSYAITLSHGLQHIIKYHSYSIINGCHFSASFSQYTIAFNHNISQSHLFHPP